MDIHLAKLFNEYGKFWHIKNNSPAESPKEKFHCSYLFQDSAAGERRMLGIDSKAAPLIWSEAKMKTIAINLGQGNHPLGITRYGMEPWKVLLDCSISLI